MDTTFAPAPHEEAARLIEGKAVVSKEVFYGLLPELRGRAFAVSGVEAANVVQRVRDAIAALPRGGEEGTWDKVKASVVEELDPWLGDGADRRAMLLIRTHGFQAFQAANWRVAQEDEDTTHLQYLATEDDRVRDTHLALNGIVLRKDDPFWAKHYPPWEWGCRCRVRPMNPDLVEEQRNEDAKRNPEDRNVIEGPALKQLENGTLIRNGQRYDVTAPSDGPEGKDAFQWHPDDLRLSLDDLKARYDRETWEGFEVWARKTTAFVEQKGTKETAVTVWEWLGKKPGNGGGSGPT
jgi:SPP1 gp7 family putative phage head morphogenesis protein